MCGNVCIAVEEQRELGKLNENQRMHIIFSNQPVTSQLSKVLFCLLYFFLPCKKRFAHKRTTLRASQVISVYVCTEKKKVKKSSTALIGDARAVHAIQAICIDDSSRGFNSEQHSTQLATNERAMVVWFSSSSRKSATHKHLKILLRESAQPHHLIRTASGDHLLACRMERRLREEGGVSGWKVGGRERSRLIEIKLQLRSKNVNVCLCLATHLHVFCAYGKKERENARHL